MELEILEILCMSLILFWNKILYKTLDLRTRQIQLQILNYELFAVTSFWNTCIPLFDAFGRYFEENERLFYNIGFTAWKNTMNYRVRQNKRLH